MMNKRKIIAGIIASVLLAGIVVSGLVVDQQNGSNGNAVVRIGSKDFTESQILGEIYALALEDNGYQVERTFNISGLLVHPSLLNEEIDLYPEYTGTGLLSILKLPRMDDPEAVYQTVKKAYAEKFNITWLDYAQATDGQGIVVRTDVAEKLGIRTISDLQKHAHEIRFASQGKFDAREDGFPGMEKTYGKFDWISSTVYDNSLKYPVLENNEADATPAYTTEGQLVNKDKFRLLEDDKRCWPPYNIAPVIRTSFLDDHPDIAGILNAISAHLTTDKMTEMNAKVDVDGENYKDVAKAFYDSLPKNK